MRMLDLFSGTGGASQAMRENGWEVVTVDINPDFSPVICGDIRDMSFSGEHFDLVWASPECKQFTRQVLPWFHDEPDPDMSQVIAVRRIIDEVNPQVWIVENVRGAVPYFKEFFGDYRKRVGSRYLWGDFPIMDVPHRFGFGKEKIPGHCTFSYRERSRIPWEISKAVERSVRQVI